MAINAKSLGFAEQALTPVPPTAGNRKVYFKNDGKMYQQNSTGTETMIGSGAGGGDIKDITYADLVTAISGGTLNKGSYYRITDYATVHYIVDGDGNRLTDIVTGVTEHLIVFATSINTIDKKVISESYPQDIIHYDWNPANWMNDVSFADANVTASIMIPNFKGVIYFRHDTLLDNYCGYDFRNVKFRRWFISNTDYSGYYATTGSASDINFKDCLTFQGDGINPNSTYAVQCHSNHIAPLRDNYKAWNEYPSILQNNVFFLGSNNYYTCYENNIGNASFANTINGDYFCGNSIIGVDFNYNQIFSTYFNYNIILGMNFRKNIIYGNFRYNTITGRLFDSNTIGGDFNNNTVDSYFYRNTVLKTGVVSENIFGCNFGYSTLKMFWHNTTKNNFNTDGSNIDFTNATLVGNADIDCQLFSTIDNVSLVKTQRLAYFNSSGVLTVVNATT